MEWIADPTQVLGGKKLSPKDILQLNRLYCDDGVVQPTTTERPTTTTKKPTTTTEKLTTTTEKPTTTTETPTTTTTEEPITTTTEGPTTTTMEPTTTTTTEQTTTPTSPGKKGKETISISSSIGSLDNKSEEMKNAPEENSLH